MAAWIVPALKAIGPHIGTIISAAAPVFTRMGADKAGNNMSLLQQQISELQTEVSRNAENTKELAAQLQVTVKAFEQAALVAQPKYQKALAFSLVAAALSIMAVSATLFEPFTL